MRVVWLTLWLMTGTASGSEVADAGESAPASDVGTPGDAGTAVPFGDSTDAGTPAPDLRSEQRNGVEKAPPSANPTLRPRWTPPSGLYVKPPPFSHRFPRIAVMFFLSGLSELAGAGVGAVAGCLIVPYGPQGCLAAFLYGSLIGGLVGIPVGVLTGGYLMDGNGSPFATIAGFIAGGALDFALLGFVLYSAQTNALRGTLIGMGFLLLPNLTSMLAYELTSDRSRRYTEMMEQMNPPKVSIAPLLVPTSRGDVIAGGAIQGRF